MSWYALIPVFIVLGLLLLFVLLLSVAWLLGKIKGGKYLRPVVTFLTKFGPIRRLFEKISTTQMERQNPELASAVRKLKRLGANPDPLRAQQAINQLTPPERRAYQELVEAQGGMPEPSNRQQRRIMERQQQGMRAPSSSSGTKSTGAKSSGTKKSKKRR